MSLLFSFPGQAALGASLARAAGYEEGKWQWRRFPDGESYVRVFSGVRGRDAVILCSLDRPDDKIPALIFLAATLKELGCGRLTLIAPYLGYMRQDKRFNEGEAVTSTIFAKLLSPFIDALITVDPHLHRHKKLEEIYSCACKVLTAAPLMSQWLAARARDILIVGPDNESEQWVRAIAAPVDAPYVILDKIRRGDREVEISLPDISPYRERMPVLVDDIISTAATMIEAIALLRRQGCGEILCLATHGVFADKAYDNLAQAGNIKIVTTNAVPHASNAIDLTPVLAAAIA